jgi:hypothetical protein
MTDSPRPTRSTVEVAVVRVEDYAELASFMADFPGARVRSVDGWHSRLRTWWDANPAFEPTFPRGWVLRDAGKIVGFFGSLPLKLQLAGRETTAFAATSWRVLPEYRGKSIGLKLRQLSAHKDALHFSTTPKEELVALLKVLGYQPIDRGPGTDAQSVLILDFEKMLRARYRDAFLGPWMAKIAAPGLGAVQALRTRRLEESGDVRDLSTADGSFDDLWERTRRRHANTNVRSAAVVRWYCFSLEPADKKLFAYYERGTLLGYMVVLLREEPTRRLLECLDVWMDPAGDEARILGALVAKAAAFARHGSYERVMFPHFNAAIAALYGGLGLLEGPAWRRREYVKGPREVLETITPANSYFVRAQGDYGL